LDRGAARTRAARYASACRAEYKAGATRPWPTHLGPVNTLEQQTFWRQALLPQTPAHCLAARIDVGRALSLPSGIARSANRSARACARSIPLSELLIGNNAAGPDRNLGKS